MEQILGCHKPKAPWGLTAEEEEGPRDVCSVQKNPMALSQLGAATGAGDTAWWRVGTCRLALIYSTASTESVVYACDPSRRSRDQ